MMEYEELMVKGMRRVVEQLESTTATLQQTHELLVQQQQDFEFWSSIIIFTLTFTAGGMSWKHFVAFKNQRDFW